MKNLLIVVALMILLGVGAAAAFVINDPAETRRLVGLTGETAGEPAPPPRQVAQAPDAPAQPTTPPAANGAAERPFDRRTADRRPPSRDEAMPDSAIPAVEVDQYARFVRTDPSPSTQEPPPPELYPYSVNRRTFPDARNISVELAIRNASGSHWETAYVTLRSSGFDEAVVFQVDEWQIDSVVGFEYTFPRNELKARLEGLRVVSVTGKMRPSALAEAFRRDRIDAIRQISGRRRNAGAILQAPGVLGVLGALQSPFTQIEIRQTAVISPRNRQIALEVPEEFLLPPVLGLTLRQTSEERREVGNLAQRFHEQALTIQDLISQFVLAVNDRTYEEAMAGEAGTIRRSLQEQLQQLNEVGRELAIKALSSQDSEIRKVRDLVTSHSQRINQQIEAVEVGLQEIDPSFRLRQS